MKNQFEIILKKTRKTKSSRRDGEGVTGGDDKERGKCLLFAILREGGREEGVSAGFEAGSVGAQGVPRGSQMGSHVSRWDPAVGVMLFDAINIPLPARSEMSSVTVCTERFLFRCARSTSPGGGFVSLREGPTARSREVLLLPGRKEEPSC